MARLRDEILAHPDRRVTFARFMERVLSEPGLGYYATSSLRPTREGDYLTAPELHPFFGRCLARFLGAAWERLGAPPRLTVSEWGAGRGTLRDSTLTGLRRERPELVTRVEWHAHDLPGRSDAVPPGRVVGIILANELLDALPVHRVVQGNEGLLECYVSWRDGWFSEVRAAPSTPAIGEHLARSGVQLLEGQRAEVGLAAAGWLAEAADRLASGLLLVIDYGHPAAELHGPRRRSGSLVTYRGHHAGDDPYVAVGRQDITAHVDLTSLDRVALERGLDRVGDTTQARFLADLGLGSLLDELRARAEDDVEAYLTARAAVVRFLDPRHLGAFRVLTWARGDADLRGLPGFGG